MAERDDELIRLAGIVDRLREGCPWDREQTLASMAPCAQEEAAEVADAVASGDPDATCEELGDLLMNVFLMARIAEQDGRFDLAGVARRIGDKLIHRHPHVFGDARAADAREALDQWERIKERDLARSSPAAAGSVLDRVPERMSALARAAKLGKRAARVGFDWPAPAGALAKVREELQELEAVQAEGADRGRVVHELGDLLFAAVNVARKLGIDADQALREANARFERRFRQVESALGPRLQDASLDEMEREWRRAKSGER